jgi:hypothetical protein
MIGRNQKTKISKRIYKHRNTLMFRDSGKNSEDNPCSLIFRAGETKPKVKTSIEANFCFGLDLAHQLCEGMDHLNL